jgi:hypothetical protein
VLALVLVLVLVGRGWWTNGRLAPCVFCVLSPVPCRLCRLCRLSAVGICALWATTICDMRYRMWDKAMGYGLAMG